MGQGQIDVEAAPGVWSGAAVLAVCLFMLCVVSAPLCVAERTPQAIGVHRGPPFVIVDLRFSFF